MATPLFPRRKAREPDQYIDTFCHWDDALKKHMVCSDFYFAKQKRELLPDRYTGTWVVPGSILRDMTWQPSTTRVSEGTSRITPEISTGGGTALGAAERRSSYR